MPCTVEFTRRLNALVSPGALSDCIRLRGFFSSNFLSLTRRAAQAAAFSERGHGRFGLHGMHFGDLHFGIASNDSSV